MINHCDIKWQEQEFKDSVHGIETEKLKKKIISVPEQNEPAILEWIQLIL